MAGALGTEAMTKEMENGLGWSDVERMVSMGAAVDVPSLVPPGERISSWIEPVKGKPLTFQTINAGQPNDVTLIPFYRTFGQRYAVYWNIYTPSQWESLQKSRQTAPAGIIDRVTIGDLVSEREHNFQAYRFQTGDRQGKKWIKSSLWFRYDLNVDPSSPNILACTFWGDDSSKFDFLIDGLPLKTESLKGEKAVGFLDVRHDIPADLIRGKRKIAVMFRSRDNKPTPEVYECATLQKNP